MRSLRDPAPSRAAYKLHRMMLTPGIRLFLRAGLPALAMFFATSIWLSNEDRRGAITDRVAEVRRQIEERPEFMVKMMAIEQASDSVAEDIRDILPIDFPVSSFDLDLDGIQARIEELDAVAAASVRVRAGGVLDIGVQERIPVVVWRSQHGIELLDKDGHRVAPIDTRSKRGDLPLIVGGGADKSVPEAMLLLAASGPLTQRLRGLVRVGDRRWDVVLDRGQIIMLPEAGAVGALEKAIALDRAQDLLARDIAAVDFRNPRRPVLRLTSDALTNLYETDWTLPED